MAYFYVKHAQTRVFLYFYTIIRFLYLILFLTALQVSGQRRFEIWNKSQAEIDLSHQYQLKISEKIHYYPRSNSLGLFYGDFFLVKHFKPWLECGAGYRINKFRLTDYDWKTENRSMLYTDLILPLTDFKLTFYNRFEYRVIEVLDDHFRYRQSVKLQFPELTSWGMQFYTSEEVFIKLNDDRTHLARFYGGINAIKHDHFILSVYYALQKTKLLQRWLSSDIIGLNLGFAI